MRVKRSAFIAAVVFVLCFALPVSSSDAAWTPPAPDVVAGTAVDASALAGTVSSGGTLGLGLLGLAGIASWLGVDTTIPTFGDTGPGTGVASTSGTPSPQLVSFLTSQSSFSACGSCTKYYPISTSTSGRNFAASDVVWDSTLYNGAYGALELGVIQVTPGGLVLEELARGTQVDDVQRATGAPLSISPGLRLL